MGLKDRLTGRLRLRVLQRKLRSLGTWFENHDLKTRILPRGTSMLVLAPHQDDESIGCGGTIKLVTSQGGRVDVMYTSDGRQGFRAGYRPTAADCAALAVTRQAEARAACQVLGVSDVTFLGGEDALLHLHAHLWRDVLERLRAHQYDFVLAPWPFDQHRDHQSTWKMTIAALEHYPRPIQVWFYEVWTPLVPNIVVDISTTADTKREAVQKFASQLAALDYAETSLALARYRSVLIPGTTHAEAFLGGDRAFALSLWSSWSGLVG